MADVASRFQTTSSEWRKRQLSRWRDDVTVLTAHWLLVVDFHQEALLSSAHGERVPLVVVESLRREDRLQKNQRQHLRHQ